MALSSFRQISKKTLMKAVKLLPKIVQICDNKFLKFFAANSENNYTVFYQNKTFSLIVAQKE